MTVWAALAEIGRDGMRARVRRHNDYARQVERRVRADPRLELLAPATLSICCFRYRAPDMTEDGLDRLNAKLAQRLRDETPFVPSTTRVGGRLAIRPCFINPRTTLVEVDGLVDAVTRIGEELSVLV